MIAVVRRALQPSQKRLGHLRAMLEFWIKAVSRLKMSVVAAEATSTDAAEFSLVELGR
jgi:hypothetical protein